MGMIKDYLNIFMEGLDSLHYMTMKDILASFGAIIDLSQDNVTNEIYNGQDFMLFATEIKLYLLPELYLSLICLYLLLYGVSISMSRNYNYPIITHNISEFSILIVGIVTFLNFMVIDPSVDQFGLTGSFLFEDFHLSNLQIFAKGLLSLILSLVLILIHPYMKKFRVNNFEYYLLILFSFLGQLVILSANNFILFYLGVEMQALAFYILASFKKTSLYSTESGLKYFIIGAVSSGLLLIGFSYLYLSVGTISFYDIAMMQGDVDGYTFYKGKELMVVGLVFVLTALLIKMGVSPFHA